MSEENGDADESPQPGGRRTEVAEYSRLDADFDSSSDRRSAASSASTADPAADDGNDASSDDDDVAGIPPDELRRGTLPSAVFNLLSTMVGGGSLSLPLAFSQSGNAFVGPLCLVGAAIVSEFCMRCLVDGGELVERRTRAEKRRRIRTVMHDGGGNEENGEAEPEEEEEDDCEEEDPRRKGSLTYERIASEAFGKSFLYFSMALIAFICFFATVGYSVLLRDLLEPYVDYLVPPPEGTGGGPTTARNMGMWLVVLGVTPLCRLTNLTSLRHVGAMSMMAVLTLGFCVAYRSLQCNFSHEYDTDNPNSSNSTDHGGGSHNDTDHHHSAHIHPRHDDSWLDYLTFVPPNISSLLSAIPIYVSCYICHYNVPPVCNELTNPTLARKRTTVRYTVWSATAFYLLVGFAGSMYGNCTPTGKVQGNVLLDFDEDDPLLLLGRTALACTVTFALPMLVIPPRDIALRGLKIWRTAREEKRKQRERESRQSMVVEGEDGERQVVPRRKRGLFSKLLRRGRGRVHPPSGAFPPALLTVNEDEIGVTETNADDGYIGEVDVSSLSEPLLSEHEHQEDNDQDMDHAEADAERNELSSAHPSSGALLLTAILVFWTAASAACFVKSIDVVWDLLGSSLSVCLGFLIPCGSYAVLFGKKAQGGRQTESIRRDSGQGEQEEDDLEVPPAAGEDNENSENDNARDDNSEASSYFVISYSDLPEIRRKVLSAKFIVGIFIPLAIACTVNAFYHTFLAPKGE